MKSTKLIPDGVVTLRRPYPEHVVLVTTEKMKSLKADLDVTADEFMMELSHSREALLKNASGALKYKAKCRVVKVSDIPFSNLSMAHVPKPRHSVLLEKKLMRDLGLPYDDIKSAYTRRLFPQGFVLECTYLGEPKRKISYKK